MFNSFTNKLQSLKNHQGFMKYFKNTSWLFLEKIIRMIVALFISIWLARYLGPEQFGILNYVLSFVGLFTAFASLGLDGIVIRELIQNNIKRDELINTAFFMKIIGFFLMLIAIIIAISFTSNDNYTNSLIFIIAFATFFQSFNVIDMYFQSKVMSKYIVYANFISLFISSLLKIIFILNNAPLIAFVWIVLFDSFILALGFLYFFFNNVDFKFQISKFSKSIAIKLLKDSWSLVLTGLVFSLYMKIDQVMIKEILGNFDLGQYSAAVRLSEAWYFIPIVIASSLFPAIINAKKISNSLYYDRFQKLYDIILPQIIQTTFPKSLFLPNLSPYATHFSFISTISLLDFKLS